MSNDVIGFSGLIFGGVIAALLTYAYFQWRDGSKQLKAPAAVRKDYDDKLKKAQASAKGGRSKQFIAVLAIIDRLDLLVRILISYGRCVSLMGVTIHSQGRLSDPNQLT